MEGSVTIKVHIIRKQDSKFLEIQVEDTGIGIKHEDQDKLFKLFGFVQDTKQLNTHGIGLGLVISEQIVNEFNGEIWFKSEPDKGSVFGFSFQLEELEADVEKVEIEQEFGIDRNNLEFQWVPYDDG